MHSYKTPFQKALEAELERISMLREGRPMMGTLLSRTFGQKRYTLESQKVKRHSEPSPITRFSLALRLLSLFF